MFPIDRKHLVASLCFLAVLSFNGCGKKKSSTSTSSDTTNVQAKIDHLATFREYLSGADRFAPDRAYPEMTKSLNQWMANLSEESKWTVDPVAEKVISQFPISENEIQPLDSLKFTSRDSQYVQEVYWASALSQWLSNRDAFIEYRFLFDEFVSQLPAEEKKSLKDAPNRLVWLLQKSQPELTKQEAETLAQVMACFDWTVRNISLDQTIPPITAESLERYSVLRDSSLTAAQRGMPAAGYGLLPDQVFAYGHGDWIQRGRVFTRIVESLGLDAAYLGVDTKKSDASGVAQHSVNPWAVAVRIGKFHFLFDPQLGLPIPNANAAGLATLEQIVADPTILRKLDLADFENPTMTPTAVKYPIDGESLKSLVVLLDIPYPALSRRIAYLENALTGAVRLSLTRNPKEQIEKWNAAIPGSRCELWSIPFEAYQYRQVFEKEVAKGNPEIGPLFEILENTYNFIELPKARHQLIIGRFDRENIEQDLAAKTLLMKMRFTDEELKKVEEDVEYQKSLGIDPEGRLTPDLKQRAVEEAIVRLETVRQIATLWLANCQYEEGDYVNSIHTFSRVDRNAVRIDVRFMAQVFDSATYNRIRCLESQLKYEEAYRAYRNLYDERVGTADTRSRSPQRHGDLLRVRFLQNIVFRQQKAEGKNETEAPTPAGTSETKSAEPAKN